MLALPHKLLRIALGALLCALPSLHAQTSPWDEILADSHWYVPAENLLAYAASGSDLTATLPLADQTLWTITSAEGGIFLGTSVATFKIGTTTTSSTTQMQGIVTASGQVRIVFTGGSDPVVGIGQMRGDAATPLIEMQMITGGSGDAGHVTHWAYMASYDGSPSVLPPLEIDPVVIAQEWAWMEGSSWLLTDPGLFGASGSGTFAIDAYRNGYFWGSGTSCSGAFTLLGSATPEGTVLFNILSDGTLTSLTGQIAGTATSGVMALRTYGVDGTLGDAATAQVIPEPSLIGLLTAATLALVWHTRRRTALRRH